MLHVIEVIAEDRAELEQLARSQVEPRRGVTDDCQRPGLPQNIVKDLDPARLGDLVGGFEAPDTVEFEVST